MVIQVQCRQHGRGFVAIATFFCLAYVKDQIPSICIRDTSRKARFIMVRNTDFPIIDQQLRDRVLARPDQISNCIDAHAFAEKVEDAGAFLG